MKHESACKEQKIKSKYFKMMKKESLFDYWLRCVEFCLVLFHPFVESRCHWLFQLLSNIYKCYIDVKFRCDIAITHLQQYVHSYKQNACIQFPEHMACVLTSSMVPVQRNNLGLQMILKTGNQNGYSDLKYKST